MGALLQAVAAIGRALVAMAGQRSLRCIVAAGDKWGLLWRVTRSTQGQAREPGDACMRPARGAPCHMPLEPLVRAGHDSGLACQVLLRPCEGAGHFHHASLAAYCPTPSGSQPRASSCRPWPYLTRPEPCGVQAGWQSGPARARPGAHPDQALTTP
eukprot:363865-Chlamydomonas_euryale.AAC.16